MYSSYLEESVHSHIQIASLHMKCKTLDTLKELLNSVYHPASLASYEHVSCFERREYWSI